MPGSCSHTGQALARTYTRTGARKLLDSLTFPSRPHEGGAIPADRSHFGGAADAAPEHKRPTFVVEYESPAGGIYSARVTSDNDEATTTADALTSEGLAARVLVFDVVATTEGDDTE